MNKEIEIRIQKTFHPARVKRKDLLAQIFD